MDLYAQRVELRPRQVEALVAAVQRGESTTLAGAHGQGKSAMITAVAQRLGSRALVVRVPPQLDTVEFTTLHVAEQLGSGVLREVSESLREHRGEPGQALGLLEAHLRSRGSCLLVDDADALLRPVDPDPELASVFAPSRFRLNRWLWRHASLRTVQARGARPRGVRLEPPEEGLVPFSLGPAEEPRLRELWAATRGNALWLRLVLSRALVTGELLTPGKRLPEEERCCEQIWAALPVPLQELVSLLALHDRPLSTAMLDELLGEQGPRLRAEALRTLLAETDGRYLWLTRPWLTWVLQLVSGPEKSRMHRMLATTFARSLESPRHAGVQALHVVEAHRHFLAVPDLAQARRYARYGVGCLLGYGRDLSRSGQYPEATQVYEAALEVVGSHYNRFKGQIEPIEETEKGYVEAVQSWPQNALFWSRLALARFVMRQPERALEALQQAHMRVPAHPEKDRVLIVRTVNRLLWRGLVQEALLVWGDYQPQGLGQLNAHGLVAALAKGWETDCLRGRSQHVFFRAPLRVTVQRKGEEFLCEVPACETRARVASPVAAVEAVVESLRRESLALHQRLFHLLTPEERERKRLLHGEVDMVRSGLLVPYRRQARLFGRLERAEGVWRFRVLDSTGVVFLLSAEQMPAHAEEGWLGYVCVATGQAGEPAGSVQELELIEPSTLRSAEELLEEWR